MARRELSNEEVASRLEKTARYCDEQDVGVAIASAKRSHELLADIVEQVRPGVRESAIRQYATELFAKHGIDRIWHAPYVRFADHTLLTFQDSAADDYVLGETDIAYLDIGIVVNGIEGDAGCSLSFGGNAEYDRLVTASKEIFDRASAYWQKENPTGIALYDFIYAQAEAYGLQWNLDPAGHLIGAYPHRGWKRGLQSFPNTVDSGKWILEIQLRHPTLPAGAFYEDLLYAR